MDCTHRHDGATGFFTSSGHTEVSPLHTAIVSYAAPQLTFGPGDSVGPIEEVATMAYEGMIAETISINGDKNERSAKELSGALARAIAAAEIEESARRA